MYARIYANMRACTHICAHICIYANMYAYMCTYTHLCEHICKLKASSEQNIRLLGSETPPREKIPATLPSERARRVRRQEQKHSTAAQVKTKSHNTCCWRPHPGANAKVSRTLIGGLMLSQAHKQVVKKHLCDDDRRKPNI